MAHDVALLGTIQRQDGRWQNEKRLFEISNKFLISFFNGLDVIEIDPVQLAHDCLDLSKRQYQETIQVVKWSSGGQEGFSLASSFVSKLETRHK